MTSLEVLRAASARHQTHAQALEAALALAATFRRRAWVYKGPFGDWSATFEGAIYQRYDWADKIRG